MIRKRHLSVHDTGAAMMVKSTLGLSTAVKLTLTVINCKFTAFSSNIQRCHFTNKFIRTINRSVYLYFACLFISLTFVFSNADFRDISAKVQHHKGT